MKALIDQGAMDGLDSVLAFSENPHLCDIAQWLLVIIEENN